jgi:hypothetical protein
LPDTQLFFYFLSAIWVYQPTASWSPRFLMIICLIILLSILVFINLIAYSCICWVTSFLQTSRLFLCLLTYYNMSLCACLCVHSTWSSSNFSNISSNILSITFSLFLGRGPKSVFWSLKSYSPLFIPFSFCSSASTTSIL